MWIPGCATGEGAYSIAIMLLEILRQNKLSNSIKVFASDIGQQSLSIAREGLYSDTIKQKISEQRLAKLFVQQNGCSKSGELLRDSVLFARQNLLTDPPFNKLDLIVVHNLSLGLNSATQKK